MSRNYAFEKGFDILPVSQNEKYIELASGERSKLCGKVKVKFRIAESGREPRGGYVDFITFYILENLTSDVLLGESLLERIRAYEELSHCFVDLPVSKDILHSEVNYIKWPRDMERKLVPLRPRIALFGSETGTACKSPCASVSFHLLGLTYCANQCRRTAPTPTP
jgi:hypothetical protein